ncbi:peptide-methionine (S)-S-oxide reductase MsrA [Paenibacillus psychroresistens]|uniref:peptide-methionine (S)-S-oxide reductase MsrA n=1 Tax=Paenibacillus psychroresistens TaxID=1778678 RepID=UPI001391F544|nr:peptide-methionine (S)-S-oxide reductase MsrA [Paenibacillus psychroresistens]
MRDEFVFRVFDKHINQLQEVLTTVNESSNTPSDIAIFAGGCFWHMEDTFQKLDGVSSVYTGYTGGHDINPTYKKVVSNTSDHLEGVEVHYNPSLITYDELLQIFWRKVDPTNADGHSAIFYTSLKQKELAEASRKELDSSKRFQKPVVMKIAAATTFFTKPRKNIRTFTKKPV